MNNTVSIVIAAYNEDRFIKEVIENVIKAPIRQLNKEIIIVNDGSTDKTLEIIRYLLRTIKQTKKIRIKLIDKIKNEGKSIAVKEGINSSKGDFVIIQDADLEYDPNDYIDLLQPLLSKRGDVVYGSRFISGKPRRVLFFGHYFANLALTTLSNIFTNLNLSDMETGYKAFRGDLIRKIAPRLQSKRFGFEPEVTARLAKVKSIRIFEVGISYWGRTYQEGKKIKWFDGVLALWEIIRFNLLEK